VHRQGGVAQLAGQKPAAKRGNAVVIGEVTTACIAHPQVVK